MASIGVSMDNGWVVIIEEPRTGKYKCELGSFCYVKQFHLSWLSLLVLTQLAFIIIYIYKLIMDQIIFGAYLLSVDVKLI